MKNNLGRILDVSSVAFLLIFAFLVLILGWLNPEMGEAGLLLFALSYCCVSVPLGFLSTIWLVWKNRSYLSNNFVWIVFQVLFVISMAMYSSPVLGLFFSSLLIILFLVIGLVDFWYAYQKGASLKFMAWGSVCFIWSILLGWRITGNLLEIWIKNISTGSNDLWWLDALMYGSAWMVVAGLAVFLVETTRVLYKEFSNA